MFHIPSIRTGHRFKLVIASFVILSALMSVQFGPKSTASAATLNSTSDTGYSIVNIAYRYLGYRYRYGGASPAGFDCSGFTKYVYGRMGIWLGHSAASQYYSGVHVSRANLRPGDLVFFANTYRRGISHVGIYIGNGKFINAANESTGVTISSLYSSYWAYHYYGATRP